jgi:hypothetical protein
MIVGIARSGLLSGMSKLKGAEGTPSRRAVKLEPFGDRSEVSNTEVPTDISGDKNSATQCHICKSRGKAGIPLKIKVA